MAASQPRDIVVTVESVSGHCAAGHFVGQQFTMGRYTPDGPFCGTAYAALFPSIKALRFGASFPWEPEEGMTRQCCPDALNPVVFRIEVKK